MPKTTNYEYHGSKFKTNSELVLANSIVSLFYIPI